MGWKGKLEDDEEERAEGLACETKQRGRAGQKESAGGRSDGKCALPGKMVRAVPGDGEVAAPDGSLAEGVAPASDETKAT